MEADELRDTIHEQKETLREHPEHVSPTNPQIIYSWAAPIRAYKKQTAGVLRFYAAVAVLLSLIVFFFREYILIVPIWTIMFLVYALTITPPENTNHAITKFGIHTARQIYPWESLSHFYFIKKFDYDIVVVFTHMTFTHPLYLVVPDTRTKNQVLQHLSHHLIYQESPNKTLTDKMAEWLTTLMPEGIGDVGEQLESWQSTDMQPNPQAGHPIRDEELVVPPPLHQTYAPTGVPPHQR